MTDIKTRDDGSNLGRVLLGLAIGLGAIFALGFTAGVTAVTFEKGASLARLALILLGATITYLAVRQTIRLFAFMKKDGLSAYERRYQRMWVVLMALGVPFGIMLSVTTNGFASSAGFMDPLTTSQAMIMVGLLAAIVVVGAIVFHRTVDDHEEQAKLWGSLIAYYFMVIFIGCWWLLQRAALVPDLTIGTALVGLILSTFVQGGVWLIVKYR